MTAGREAQLSAFLGLTTTSCARYGHEAVQHTRLSDCPHHGHPVPYQERKQRSFNLMQKTFCANHGVNVPEGDICNECLLSTPEQRAIAQEIIDAINKDLAIDYIENAEEKYL